LFCSSTHGSQLATRNHPWFAFTTSTTGWIHPINFEREKKSKVSRQHNTCKHWWVPEVTLRTPGKGIERGEYLVDARRKRRARRRTGEGRRRSPSRRRFRFPLKIGNRWTRPVVAAARK
jgi:hypothetical protein